jgi:hypothetical protein
MFSPLCDGGNESKKKQDIERNCTPLHWVHNILFLSHIGDLLLSSIIGIQTMVKIESSVKQTGQHLSGPVFYNAFHRPYVHRQYFLQMRGPSSENCRKTREFFNMSQLQM